MGFGVGGFEVGKAGVEGFEGLLGQGAYEGKGDVGRGEAYADWGVSFVPPGVRNLTYDIRAGVEGGQCSRTMSCIGTNGGRMAEQYLRSGESSP